MNNLEKQNIYYCGGFFISKTFIRIIEYRNMLIGLFYNQQKIYLCPLPNAIPFSFKTIACHISLIKNISDFAAYLLENILNYYTSFQKTFPAPSNQNYYFLSTVNVIVNEYNIYFADYMYKKVLSDSEEINK